MAHMDPSWVMIPSAAFGFAGGNPWCSNAQKKNALDVRRRRRRASSGRVVQIASTRFRLTSNGESLGSAGWYPRKLAWS